MSGCIAAEQCNPLWQSGDQGYSRTVTAGACDWDCDYSFAGVVLQLDVPHLTFSYFCVTVLSTASIVNNEVGIKRQQGITELRDKWL